MAFVNESLTEQDKAWFASFKFQSVFTRDLVPLPRKWTIDRDRDAVLIGLEGRGCEGRGDDIPPLFMVLIWASQVIRIQAYNRGEGSYERGTEEWWRLTYIGVQKILEPQVATVLQLIHEALDAQGTNFRRDMVKAVHIQLPTPEFI